MKAARTGMLWQITNKNNFDIICQQDACAKLFRSQKQRYSLHGVNHDI